MGCDPLNATLKDISKNSELSTSYTNHCIRASVVTNLNDSGYEARDIMATAGHKSEPSIRSYAKKVPIKKRRDTSDSLSSKFVEPEQKKKVETVSVPPPKEKDDVLALKIFPDFEDDELVKVLTQIEKENKQLSHSADKQKDNQVKIAKVKSAKTINYSASVANISNVNCTPMMPHMYFPHSNVTIDYNFPK